MKTKRRWSDRTRLILTLELAIGLPAAALVILSAMHLRSVQRDKGIQAAFERDFYQVLKISEKDFNHRAYELLDDVREEFPKPNAACSETMDRLLASHPYVAHVFIYDPQSGFIFRSQPSRMNSADFRRESSETSSMSEGWMKLEYKDVIEMVGAMGKQGPQYHAWENDAPRGNKHLYQSGVLFLTADNSGQKKAIGGIVFDAEYLHDEFFPQMLDQVLNHQEEKGEKNHVVMELRTKSEETPVAYSTGWDGGEPEVERNLEGVFPGLVLGIKLPGTTLAALEDRFVRTDFIVLGVISLMLTGGIVLTYRNVLKEMALAKLKSDFVSNVSHELRTPLSLIRLYAETLEMGRLKSQEKYQEYYSIIRKESERLTALINNILDFSRIEAGRKEYDFRETDMRELVRNTLESYRYQIEQNGFAFEEKIAEDVPPLRVDREAMARSLLNLVNNSLKYSQDRKYLGVNLYRANGSVKLEVVDHGIGIPVEERGKIFEKFYRVGDPLVHTTRGSGLGLSLVRHIVKAHGGEVSVDSEPGQGSTFTISLPVAGTGQVARAALA